MMAVLAMDHFYRDHAGPYLLGNRVTYADFAVYQSIDNDERTGTLCLLQVRHNIGTQLENFPKLDQSLRERCL
jgi:glutathione S-transferase